MASEPTRVELDLPVVTINRYGHMEMENHKSVDDVLATFFNKGEVITVHIIAESNSAQRGFCDFIDPTSQFKSVCGQILNADGICWMESTHQEKRVKQLELKVTESD